MIDVEKLKADLEAAKGAPQAAIIVLQAIQAEARSLRMADGGAAMVTMDALVVSIDGVIAKLAPPPPPAPAPKA